MTGNAAAEAAEHGGPSSHRPLMASLLWEGIACGVADRVMVCCLATQEVKNSDALRGAIAQVQDANVALGNRFSESRPLYDAFAGMQNRTALSEVQERIVEGILLTAEQGGVTLQVGLAVMGATLALPTCPTVLCCVEDAACAQPRSCCCGGRPAPVPCRRVPMRLGLAMRRARSWTASTTSRCSCPTCPRPSAITWWMRPRLSRSWSTTARRWRGCRHPSARRPLRRCRRLGCTCRDVCMHVHDPEPGMAMSGGTVRC